MMSLKNFLFFFVLTIGFQVYCVGSPTDNQLDSQTLPTTTPERSIKPIQRLLEPEDAIVCAISDAFEELLHDSSLNTVPSCINSHFRLLNYSDRNWYWSAEDKYQASQKTKKDRDIVDFYRKSYKKKIKKNFAEAFKKKSEEFYKLLKRIRYTPPKGVSYILSGCTGFDAVLEHFTLQKYFKKFPESSFEYVSIEKSETAVQESCTLIGAAGFKNWKIIPRDIAETEDVLRLLEIDPKKISLFLCCHPPVISTKYKENVQDLGIGQSLVREMSKEIYDNALKCITVYFDYEALSLIQILIAQGKYYEIFCKTPGYQNLGTPYLNKQCIQSAHNAWNAYRVSFIIE